MLIPNKYRSKVDAFEIFHNQSERELSFADAAIVAIAQQKARFIATFDEDFRGLKGLRVVPDD